jgi:hypothetical protein
VFGYLSPDNSQWFVTAAQDSNNPPLVVGAPELKTATYRTRRAASRKELRNIRNAKGVFAVTIFRNLMFLSEK